MSRYETSRFFSDIELTVADLSAVWYANPDSKAVFMLYGGPGWAFAEADFGASNDSLTAHVGIGFKLSLSERFYLRPDTCARWFEKGDDETDFEASLAFGVQF